MGVLYYILGWVLLISSFFVDDNVRSMVALVAAMIYFVGGGIYMKLVQIEKKLYE